MSGGSFDYLHSKDLTDGKSLVAAMRDYLHKAGHHDAALATAEVVAAMERVDQLQAQLSDVWHDAEWVASGDYGPDDLAQEVEKWRKAGKVPAPERVDVAKRLYELEKEAIQLRLKLASDGYAAGEE